MWWKCRLHYANFSDIYLLKVVVNVVADLPAIRQMKETQLTVLLRCMNQRTLSIRNRWDEAAHIKNRISKVEAMVLAVLAKKNISFSTVGKLLVTKACDFTKHDWQCLHLENFCLQLQSTCYNTFFVRTGGMGLRDFVT